MILLYIFFFGGGEDLAASLGGCFVVGLESEGGCFFVDWLWFCWFCW